MDKSEQEALAKIIILFTVIFLFGFFKYASAPQEGTLNGQTRAQWDAQLNEMERQRLEEDRMHYERIQREHQRGE